MSFRWDTNLLMGPPAGPSGVLTWCQFVVMSNQSEKTLWLLTEGVWPSARMDPSLEPWLRRYGGRLVSGQTDCAAQSFGIHNLISSCFLCNLKPVIQCQISFLKTQLHILKFLTQNHLPFLKQSHHTDSQNKHGAFSLVLSEIVWLKLRNVFFMLMFEGKIIQSPHLANLKVCVGVCVRVFTVLTS